MNKDCKKDAKGNTPANKGTKKCCMHHSSRKSCSILGQCYILEHLHLQAAAIAVITQQKKSTTKQGGKAMRAANEKGAEVKIIIRP
jgi:hypothetical protein